MMLCIICYAFDNSAQELAREAISYLISRDTRKTAPGPCSPTSIVSIFTISKHVVLYPSHSTDLSISMSSAVACFNLA